MTNISNDPHDRDAEFLNEIESKQILRQAGIRVTEPVLARSRAEAVSIARGIGFPVVLKIVSPEITHKSDVGGVITGLNDSESVGQAYDRMLESIKKQFPQAAIGGISVQSQAPAGVEIIIGMTRDPQFGPAIMFGLGGVMVEIFNDVCIRIAPLSREDVSEMVRGVKSYPLLNGYRGRPKVDTDTLEDWLLKVSDLSMNHPRIKELDINPIFAYADGAIAVDARILLED
jgi:acetate---CoA ligase (ADP-forming) subunit beta